MIIKLSMCFCYFIFSATPTTDILRLLKNSKTPISTIPSYCDHCGYVIPHWEQLPVISFVLHKGKCRYCGEKIPIKSVFLEGFTFTMMVGITTAFHFRPIGVVVSFLCYELLKVLFIIIFGARENSFWKEFSISLRYNICFFSLFVFMSILL